MTHATPTEDAHPIQTELGEPTTARPKRRRRRRVLRIASALLLIGVLVLAAFVCGCFAGTRRPTTMAGLSVDAPRLIHIVGWNGPVAGDRAFLESLRAGGCPHAMETFDWTDGHNGVFALRHAQRSDLPVQRLIERIEALHAVAPNNPIDVTADSSGCGVLLTALGRLPGDVHVRTVILSSPAVSCGYDLAPALAHVDGRLIAFHSERDWFILGLGTWIFGTVDGHHASGAGRYGFAARDDPKLVQIAYDPAWRAAYGNWGLHAQSLAPGFARGYLAPLLTRDPPTSQRRR